MKDFLRLGVRVKVRSHSNWPNEASGIIDEPPAAVREMVANDYPWTGLIRTVKGRHMDFTFVWVRFDLAQLDGDGDGPYSQGEVDIHYVGLA